MLKFLHTANYFYYQASERLENKISKINSAIDEFQSQYPTKLRMISNNQIAIDNRKQLTQVRKKNITKRNPSYLPYSLAKEILDYCRPTDEFVDFLEHRDIDTTEMVYEDINEVYWGTPEELALNEGIFFYVLMKDLLNSDSYCDLVNTILIDSPEYALYQAYENLEITRENTVSIYDIYSESPNLNDRKKIISQAIYRFYVLHVKDKLSLSQKFFDFISVNGHSLTFNNMQTRLVDFLKNYLLDFLVEHKAQENSLGYRIYTIYKDDIQYLHSKLLGDDISEIDEELLSATTSYCKTLIKIQHHKDSSLEKIPDCLVTYIDSVDLVIQNLEKYQTGVTTIDELITTYQEAIKDAPEEQKFTFWFDETDRGILFD